MADVFEVLPDGHRSASKMCAARFRLWSLIEVTPHLDWLLLTKRPENHKLVPLAWQTGSRRPPNVWLGVTAENQEQVDKRIPHLINAIWPAVRFVSYEPALELIRIQPKSFTHEYFDYGDGIISKRIYDGIDWLICGAESGHGARPMSEDWVRSIRDQCATAEIPFFYKQKIDSGKKVSLPLLDGVRHAAFPSAFPSVLFPK